MRTDQLALQLEDTGTFVRQWSTLPTESRKTIARIYARLCVRAAKVSAPVGTEKGHSEPCTQNR